MQISVLMLDVALFAVLVGGFVVLLRLLGVAETKQDKADAEILERRVGDLEEKVGWYSGEMRDRASERGAAR